MIMRPSPEPRSITKSCGVTFAMSSIFSTISGVLGTQTTSFPAMPDVGSQGLGVGVGGACVCWNARTNAMAATEVIQVIEGLLSGNQSLAQPRVYKAGAGRTPSTRNWSRG